VEYPKQHHSNKYSFLEEVEVTWPTQNFLPLCNPKVIHNPVTPAHMHCPVYSYSLCVPHGLRAFLCNFNLKFLHPGSSWNSNPSVTKRLKVAMTPSPEPDQPSPQSVPPTHFTVTLRSVPWYPSMFSKQNSACVHPFHTHVKCHICITFLCSPLFLFTL